MLRHLFKISLIVTLLAGCNDDSPTTLFDTYLDRVSNVQASDSPEVSVTYTALPRKRELRVDIPPLTLGLLDSYQLRQCGLFELIAQRNSVLGKVADEFRNYDYQRDLLKGLSDCVENDQLEPTLKQTLREIQKQKHQQLTLHQSNLLYASEAMQQQLSGSRWLGKGLSEPVTQIDHALSTLSMSFIEPLEEGNVTKVQEVLEKNAIVGNLDYSLVHATQQLETVTSQLKKYDERIICGPQRDDTKFRHLNNVFEQQYVAKIQPYMATIDSYYQQLSPHFTLFEPAPERLDYHFPIKQHHDEFRQAIKAHVSYWQSLFKRCGRQVGRS